METKTVSEIIFLGKEETRRLIQVVNPKLRLASWVYELTKVIFLLTVGYDVGQMATVPGDVSPASIYGYGAVYVLVVATVAFIGMLMYRDNLAWYRYHLTEHLDSIKDISWA